MTKLIAVRIRKAESRDVPVLYEFVLALDRENGTLRDPEIFSEDIAAAGFGDDPCFEAVIAEKSEGTPLGPISFFRGYSGWLAKPVAVVHMLYVQKDARRQGIAEKLMADVASCVVARGWARLQLCVEEGSTAIAFYEALGMQKCKEKQYSLDGAALLDLAKSG